VNATDYNASMDAALHTFIAESRELLREMEVALLVCEQGSMDTEGVNAVFRAAHTIKGSSGLFGLENIVSFTHVVESVLDRVRAGHITMQNNLATLLLECTDHISVLVEAVAGNDATGESQIGTRAGDLIARLQGVMAATDDQPIRAEDTSNDAPKALTTADTAIACTECWHISLRFKPDVLRHGMDPLSFIRYLRSLGELRTVELVDDAMPPVNEMDAEACYIGFEINFRSDASKERIEGAFEFVRDDCLLHILPPRSNVADYVRVLEELPEAEGRLGDILVRLGTLTKRELDQALRMQKELAAKEGGPMRPLGEILVQERMVQAPVVEAALEKQRNSKETKLPENRSIRIDADKLEKLTDLIGELIIAGASTRLIAQRLKLSELSEATHRLSRLVEEVRDHTLKLRMVPLGITFSRFQRVVRDLAREMKKDIRLESSGGETELDKMLMERIADPLTHLVRNAIDHGIEQAAARVAAGKSSQGVIGLHAYHESGSVVIEVSDDGAGLQRDRILKKAWERGLIGDVSTLTDAEVAALIFAPGFSTAEQLTNISGRGVGMDVVKRNIEALRGTVELISDAGKGTTIRIRMPLTLAIIDGFQVGVGRASYVIPLDLVNECVELDDMDRAALGKHRYFNLRGGVVPYVRLRELFGVPDKGGRRESLVIAQFAGQRVGIVVDDLQGECQTVIKPMARMFNHVKCVSGSTILGNGSVALILDVAALAQYAELRCAAKVAGAAA
jgi:two-component system, chemotaxis family, sensor kinase CheA